jgi:alkylation response protein AidB-like acyl-CoA dehydrogenase
MEFRFSDEDEAFRATIKAFLAEKRALISGSEADDGRAIEREMARHGWLTMAWPKEYGGGGATHTQQLIFKEEMARAGASVDFQGINLAGPAIMINGTDEQKREHLPRIARAEVRWCQGFSEPGAGSDLAALQTRAVRDGDDYVINGQKIWTSYADTSDWIHMLARTDPDAPKHRGISYFIVDMKTPGITARRLTQITGVPGFCETFFEDVRVPGQNMLGELNRGWYAATTTLDFERSGVERNLIAERDLGRVLALARSGASPVAATSSGAPARRPRLADLAIEVEVGRWICRRVAWMQGQGLVPNYESSMSKAYNSEVGQRVADFAINYSGMTGQISEGPSAGLDGMASFRYLDSRRLTIGQGTSEIQRNIIATRGLGLPRG